MIIFVPNTNNVRALIIFAVKDTEAPDESWCKENLQATQWISITVGGSRLNADSKQVLTFYYIIFRVTDINGF